MSNSTLHLMSIHRCYPYSNGFVPVLSGVECKIKPGEIVALVGPSGAGKSTLLHTAGLLERPQSGKISILGQDCTEMDDKHRTAMRRNHIGFVYQFHHLLPEFTALENVMMPQRLLGVRQGVAKSVAEGLLHELGLANRISFYPQKLSGGEQQRVAIARALANAPDILLADEPTGNLDQATSDLVFKELLKLARNRGLSALVATHNVGIASRMDRSVRLVKGKLA